jgi:hypothetical protein
VYDYEEAVRQTLDQGAPCPCLRTHPTPAPVIGYHLVSEQYQ